MIYLVYIADVAAREVPIYLKDIHGRAIEGEDRLDDNLFPNHWKNEFVWQQI